MAPPSLIDTSESVSGLRTSDDNGDPAVKEPTEQERLAQQQADSMLNNEMLDNLDGNLEEGGDAGPRGPRIKDTDYRASRFDNWWERKYKAFMRWNERMARKISVEAIVWVAVVFGAVYSLVLSYLPLPLVQFLFGNGLWENRITTTGWVRSTADACAQWGQDHLRPLITIMQFFLALALAIPLLLIAIMANPKAMRSILMVTLPPVAGLAIFWELVYGYLPPLVKKPESIAMAGSGLAAGCGLAVLALFGFAFFRNVVEFLLGELTLTRYFVSLVFTVGFGTAMAILHVEGNRKYSGKPYYDPGTVHRYSVGVAGLVTSAVLLIMPAVNRRVWARMRLMGAS